MIEVNVCNVAWYELALWQVNDFRLVEAQLASLAVVAEDDVMAQG